MCRDLVERAEREGADVYELMTEEAQASPPGANGLLFNPNLAGGTGLDPDPRVRGAFAGLDLRHSRGDLIRAAMEGIAMGLRGALDALKNKTDIEREMLVVGGGSASHLWRRILADVYEMTILKTNIDQDAAALGAAALAAVGTGQWGGFDRIDTLHEVEDRTLPDAGNVGVYRALQPLYAEVNRDQAHLAQRLTRIHLEKREP
jgi:xylulokinase